MTPTAEHTATAEVETQPAVSPQILICPPPMSSDALDTLLARFAEAFEGEPVAVATPDHDNGRAKHAGVLVETFTPTVPPQLSWVPRAADYLNAWTVARDRRPRVVVLLGPEAATISAGTLKRMVQAVMAGRDLALPRFPTGPHDALVNSAILHPVTQALFSLSARFPLPVDVALSSRMAERLAAAAQRMTAANQNDALLWPAAEAAVASYGVQEVAGDERYLPHPGTDSLNALLTMVAGSLFSDVEAKSAFWQRARLTARISPPDVGVQGPAAQAPPEAVDTAPLIEAFRNAYANLRELWSLVLPPNSLLSLKKLSIAPVESFRMPDDLWARTVYDFMLAYRLRTINRGHLLGALMPLYLGWVASHLLLIGGDAQLAEQHIQAVAAAFENGKPYFVSRWRWPDRFNP